MNGQSVLEIAWHLGVITFATPPFARCMLRHRSAWLVALGVLAAGAVYHVWDYPSG